MRKVMYLALTFLLTSGFAQSQTPGKGAYSMEIKVERWEGQVWKTVDPALVFSTDDRIRLNFRTTFNGYIYVTQQSTSGKYEQLFPRVETGRNNRVEKDTDYIIPATDTVFRVGGPAGQDIIYWLMSPVSLSGDQSTHVPLSAPPPPEQASPADMTPRCDGEIFRSRGDCVDSSAGPQGVAEKEKLPDHLARTARSRDLLFMRKQNSTVIASTSPLSGPVVYELRLAHR